VLFDKFIAGDIIAKLPPSWINFATSLKNKRQEFCITDLIASLDMEEKTREKDTHARCVERGIVQTWYRRKNFNPTEENQYPLFL
jgi:hypothetical protein